MPVGEWPNALPLWSETRQDVHSPLLFYGDGSSNQGNKAGKRNERYYIGKEELILSLFTDDILLLFKILRKPPKIMN